MNLRANCPITHAYIALNTDTRMTLPTLWQADLQASVQFALEEDIQNLDITAELIPAEQHLKARIITREQATICGVDWVNEVFAQLDGNVTVTWFVKDGDIAHANDTLFELEGCARSLMTGERAALNFLQLLSGVATKASEYAAIVKGTNCTILDTRKTIPGLRTAQKYAVSCGGCENHRIGLYDAFLIKENHIAACGGIEKAINTARSNHSSKPVEVEVESLAEFDMAISAGADIIMLDNFSNDDKRIAVQRNIDNGKTAKLEASGGITKSTLREVAETGIDYISIGTLTKDIQSIDLSMRIID